MRAVVAASVDEEGRGSRDAAAVGGIDVLGDAGRVGVAGEVVVEAVDVQAQFGGVADEVVEFEVVLVGEQEVVHPVLRRGPVLCGRPIS